MYDLIIHNASILDGTGAQPFTADIGILQGKIARIAQGLSGAAQDIDAAGLTVSPGWIDSHSHSDRDIFSFPEMREKVEQGITFSITGQCGASPAPKRRGNRLETVGAHLTEAAAVPQGSGSALLIGHNTLRRAVMGSENRAPSRAELEMMKDLLREGLQSGAIGMSLGLFYVPGCYADTDEVLALAKVTAEHGGVISAHLRNEDCALMEALEEFIHIVQTSGAQGIVSHHKAMWRENWGRVKDSVSRIERAIEEGVDLYMDVYPYDASSTTLLSRFVPAQFHPPGITGALQLLEDPDVTARIHRWAKGRWGNDFAWVMITGCKAHQDYEGLTVNQIADLRGQQDRMDTVFDILRDDNGETHACFFLMSEDDVRYVLRHPRAMIGTDSGVAGDSASYHPRLRASFPRVLGRYVRDRQLVSLPEMIRRMTSLPAEVYGLTEKGRIAEGFDADLCIFDPLTIRDRADFANCTLPNEGLRYVIIGGQIAAKDGVYTGIRAASVLLRK